MSERANNRWHLLNAFRDCEDERIQNPNARALWVLGLWSRADGDGWCHPSQPTLMKDSGIRSTNTLRKYIGILVDAGWVTQEEQPHFRGFCYRYRVHFPEGEGVSSCTLSDGEGVSSCTLSDGKGSAVDPPRGQHVTPKGSAREGQGVSSCTPTEQRTDHRTDQLTDHVFVAASDAEFVTMQNFLKSCGRDNFAQNTELIDWMLKQSPSQAARIQAVDEIADYRVGLERFKEFYTDRLQNKQPNSEILIGANRHD